jgi:hypothetical protein
MKNVMAVSVLAVLLLTSYIVASISVNLVIAKKPSNVSSSSSSSSSTSGGTGGSNSGSLGNTNVNNPLHPGKEDTKDISDIPSENGKGVHFIHPIKPNPNVCHFDSCFPRIHPHPHSHNTVVIVKHSSSSSSNHNLSGKCFDEIKIAWLGKIHRGQNHDVDNIIDKCLGVN